MNRVNTLKKPFMKPYFAVHSRSLVRASSQFFQGVRGVHSKNQFFLIFILLF